MHISGGNEVACDGRATLSRIVTVTVRKVRLETVKCFNCNAA